LQADRSVYPLMIYLPRKGISLAADPTAALSSATIYPQGSFAIQSEFDNQYAITDLNFLKTYMSYADDEYSAIEIKLSEKSNGAELQDQLQSMLGAGFLVENRYEQNRTLYTTIRLEKWAIYAIFTLILVVAAFNMIGALSMLVLEKQKDIQVLKAMGAADLLIQRIFLAEGILLGTLGAIAGMVLSLLVYFLQTRFKLVPLQGATFLIDHYPLKLMVSDFIIVATTVWIIAIAAAWFPAKKASQRTMDLRN
jgi:lipoprotein-releasing system permease protein